MDLVEFYIWALKCAFDKGAVAGLEKNRRKKNRWNEGMQKNRQEKKRKERKNQHEI